jgi:transposase
MALEPILKELESKESVVTPPAICFLRDMPMWKPEHRVTTNRCGLRYPSDLTDAEWSVIAPMIPPAKRGGRKRTVNVCDVFDARGFVVLTKRRIVERTFAWIIRNRRLMRDFERYSTLTEAFVRRSMVRIMLKRLRTRVFVPES